MRHNMGKTERGIRIVGSVVLLLISLVFLNGAGVLFGIITGVTVLGLILTLIGIVVFATGISGYCPINQVLHINSCQACRLGETHKHLPV
jgi:Inner membrane protein YgaP-like, transmembrane domain